MSITGPHKRFIPLFTTLNLLLFSDVFESVKNIGEYANEVSDASNLKESFTGWSAGHRWR